MARNLSMSLRSRRAVVAAAATVLAGGVAIVVTQPVMADSPDSRAEQFTAAAEEFDIPESVLLGVSYMESRWVDHAGRYSAAGGFGPMHLTDAQYVQAAEDGTGHYEDEDPRGDARRPFDTSAADTGSPEVSGAAYQTLTAAADLIDVDAETLRTDPAANIRGGAALLASHYEGSDADDPASWYGAVAQYAGAESESGAQFADQVYDVINSGADNGTDAGAVTLDATPVSPDRATLADDAITTSADQTDCPDTVDCEWVPAPYEQYGEDPSEYGNHDQADRPNDMDIDYIVVHSTETSYTNALKLVQDPTYVSWQYTMRSFDGHVAQHMSAEDVGWHAGNWSVNSHSLGIEHEGVASEGSWFTEAMYAASSDLVKHLAEEYDVPLDRAHILGHDNVPGTSPDTVAGMHWDPGPFWDWEHYFDLLGAAPESAAADTGLVTVAPSWDTNLQEFTGCDASNPEGSCGERSASTVFLRSEPKDDAPLLNDPVTGKPATTTVNDGGSRAGYGQTFAVAETKDDWTAVWYLGQKGWIHNPADAPVLKPAMGQKVTPKSDDIPVYGVAYPEAEAYEGTDVPVQEVTPLPYKLGTDQSYSVAGEVPGEYFYAKSFDAPTTVVTGDRTYYEVQIGGRLMYLDSADVEVG